MKISCQTTIKSNFKLDITSHSRVAYLKLAGLRLRWWRWREVVCSPSQISLVGHHGPRWCLKLTEAVMSWRRTGWRTWGLITLHTTSSQTPSQPNITYIEDTRLTIKSSEHLRMTKSKGFHLNLQQQVALCSSWKSSWNFYQTSFHELYINILNYSDSNDMKNWLMKRWNTYFIGKKTDLASKENITIQKLFGYKKAETTIRNKPHIPRTLTPLETHLC